MLVREAPLCWGSAKTLICVDREEMDLGIKFFTAISSMLLWKPTNVALLSTQGLICQGTHWQRGQRRSFSLHCLGQDTAQMWWPRPYFRQPRSRERVGNLPLHQSWILAPTKRKNRVTDASKWSPEHFFALKGEYSLIKGARCEHCAGFSDRRRTVRAVVFVSLLTIASMCLIRL